MYLCFYVFNLFYNFISVSLSQLAFMFSFQFLSNTISGCKCFL